MSRLLLDVGNSRLKWAFANAGSTDVTASGAVEHGGDPVAALDRIVLPVELRGTVAWAANVTGAAHEAGLRQRARDRFDLDLRFATVPAEYLGLKVAYADPSRLGVDRWLQMLALWSDRNEAFAVASAGTALTFDAVDGGGQHLGGIIAPGLLTAQQAVLGATRFAASGPQDDFTAGLGTDTEACVRQGALHACAGLLERLGGRFGGAGARRILSGGDAQRLLAQLAPGWQLRADLVLSGLLVLAATE
jgi:type III pantothenate kinase